jgi:hypothetical protein
MRSGCFSLGSDLYRSPTFLSAKEIFPALNGNFTACRVQKCQKLTHFSFFNQIRPAANPRTLIACRQMEDAMDVHENDTTLSMGQLSRQTLIQRMQRKQPGCGRHFS